MRSISRPEQLVAAMERSVDELLELDVEHLTHEEAARLATRIESRARNLAALSVRWHDDRGTRYRDDR